MVRGLHALPGHRRLCGLRPVAVPGPPGTGRPHGRAIFRYYRSVVEELYEPKDFTMPEGIVMSGGFAYRADMPLQGASATDAGAQDGTVVDTSEGGEDLMRQMF